MLTGGHSVKAFTCHRSGIDNLSISSPVQNQIW